MKKEIQSIIWDLVVLAGPVGLVISSEFGSHIFTCAFLVYIILFSVWFLNIES